MMRWHLVRTFWRSRISNWKTIWIWSLPDTAVGEYLDRAVAAFGVTRKTASAAVRKMITTGAVPIGSRWGAKLPGLYCHKGTGVWYGVRG